MKTIKTLFNKTIKFSALFILLAGFLAASGWSAPKIGYLIHFNGLRSGTQALELLDSAKKGGAEVINIIPPSHIWEDPESLAVLQALIKGAEERKLEFIITRIDANTLSGTNYLYENILSEGRGPEGRPDTERILGNKEYAEWMKEETEFYGKEFGNSPYLTGFSPGIIQDPFQTMFTRNGNGKYIFNQRTQFAREYWMNWLTNKLGSIERINQEYNSQFGSLTDIPVPASEEDQRYYYSRRAYYDFMRSVNDWFMQQYQENRDIWKKYSSKPFILGVSWNTGDILAAGSSCNAALDIQKWFVDADAIGLTFYTDANQPDGAMGTLQATLNLTGMATEMGKPLYVLEMGHRGSSKEPGTYYRELGALLSLPSQPEVLIYRYFHENVLSQASDPRYMVNAAARNIEPSFTLGRKALATARMSKFNRNTPYLYVISYPLSVRDDGLAGDFYNMLHSASRCLPLRWVDYNDVAFIPSQSLVLLAPAWKRPLSDYFLNNFQVLAKRRDWQVMVDDNNYPSLRTVLGKDIKGATIDLKSFLQDTSVANPGAGFAAAIADYYETQYKIIPNKVTPIPGMAVLSGENDIRLFFDKTPEEAVKLDLSTWNPGKTASLNLLVSTRAEKPIPLLLTTTGKSSIKLDQVKVVVRNAKTGRFTPVTPEVVKEGLGIMVQPQVEYALGYISQPKGTLMKAEEQPAPEREIKADKKALDKEKKNASTKIAAPEKKTTRKIPVTKKKK